MNDDNVNDTVTITGDEYLMLYRRLQELNALEDAGVDHWERYGSGDMFARVEWMVAREAHQRGLMYDVDDESDTTDVTSTMSQLGLCGIREDHEPHAVSTGSLSPYWCHADQSHRLPYAAEQRRKKMQNAGMFTTY